MNAGGDNSYRLADAREKNWIDTRLNQFMEQTYFDIRKGRPAPLSVSMHPITYQHFTSLLKSKNAYFPDGKGLKFLGVPVRINTNLPTGCFVVEKAKIGYMVPRR